MTDLEHVKFLDRILKRGGDVLDKVETYVKYLKYAEVYNETSDSFKKLFEPNVLAIILSGKSTFSDAYSALSNADFDKLNINRERMEKRESIELNFSSCHSNSSSSSRCGSSSSSSRCGSSTSSCHSSSSSSSRCSSSSQSSCYSSSGC